MGTGKPVETRGPVPSCVKTGFSLDETQPLAFGENRSEPSREDALVPAGATTDRMLTGRMEPSSKISVTAARRTPGLRFVIFGCTRICAGAPGWIVPF